MIVVDSSVWIDHLNDRVTPEVERLRGLVGRAAILVGDLILLEVLQGLRDEREAALVERALRHFEVVAMLDPGLASIAAANYRLLRGLGVTLRKTADLIIGTFCIEGGHTLLHSDRDFLPMQTHLGLRTVIADVGEA
jgi:predicted nucleic acid-binding protein